jgi:uncharacterized protein YcbK (DUF882 family)
MLTATDLLTTCGAHEDRLAWVSPAVEANAHTFVEKVNALLMRFGESRKLTSGFRDPKSNKAAMGSSYSWHMFGLAADIEDRPGTLGAWVKEHPEALEACGLYAEHPTTTPGWVHVQSEPPPSKKRLFWP